MRYIRTEERIYIIVKCEDLDEEEKSKIPQDCVCVYANNIFGCSIINSNRIIKQADTIEELCDEFVASHKTLKSTYCIRKTPFKEQDESFNIYGAIWTKWGLKYVAKMNEKGELELL